jgi:hypothetical protein
MRKNVGVILLFCGIGMLIALFGLIAQRFFGEEIMWAYYGAIVMIYCGAIIIGPEEDKEDDEEN